MSVSWLGIVRFSLGTFDFPFTNRPTPSPRDHPPSPGIPEPGRSFPVSRLPRACQGAAHCNFSYPSEGLPVVTFRPETVAWETGFWVVAALKDPFPLVLLE